MLEKPKGKYLSSRLDHLHVTLTHLPSIGPFFANLPYRSLACRQRQGRHIEGRSSDRQTGVLERSCAVTDAKYLQFDDTQLSPKPPISRCEADRFQVNRVLRCEPENAVEALP
jgi:hypothetical protein